MRHLLHINSFFLDSRLHGDLVAALAEREALRQTIYCPVPRGVPSKGLEGFSAPNTILVRRENHTDFDRRTWVLKMAKIIRDGKRVIADAEERIGAVHGHTLIINGLTAKILSHRLKVPYFVTVRNTDLNVYLKRRSFFRKLAAHILKGASGIVFLGPAYWEVAFPRIFGKALLGEIRGRVRIIPNGIHPSWYESPVTEAVPVVDNLFEILFVGRVDKNKNLAGLAEACDRLWQRNIPVRLTIVGDGPAKPAVTRREWSFPLRDLGPVFCRDRLRAVFRECHLLAVTSFTESFGLVYAEALSQGRPVIYTKGQGFDGWFSHGDLGFGVDAKDVEDIAEKMEMAFNDLEGLWRRVRLSKLRFSWDASAKSLLEMYTDSGFIQGKNGF